MSDSSNLPTLVTRVVSTTTSGTSLDGLVELTESCSRVSTLLPTCIHPCRSSVLHICSTDCWDSSRPLWRFQTSELGVSNIVMKCSLRCHKHSLRVFRFWAGFPSRSRCWRTLGVQRLSRERPSEFDLRLHDFQRFLEYHLR